MRVLGVDACKGGWVTVELSAGAFVSAYAVPALAELPDAQIIGVDMPLGLVERGWREADVAAAAVLGPRRSSLFRMAPRAAWDEPDFASANQRCRQLAGGGLSRQAWALRGKLREANVCRQGSWYEVHPEVSFRLMAGAVLAYPKTSWQGLNLRRRLLAEQGVVVPDDIGEAGRAAPDDVLDAAAAAWSAYRVARGVAVPYPDPPQGEIAIWA